MLPIHCRRHAQQRRLLIAGMGLFDMTSFACVAFVTLGPRVLLDATHFIPFSRIPIEAKRTGGFSPGRPTCEKIPENPNKAIHHPRQHTDNDDPNQDGVGLQGPPRCHYQVAQSGLGPHEL